MARSSEEEGRRREGKEGCGVRVRGDLRASLYVYHTAARPLPERRERGEWTTTKETKVQRCLWDRFARIYRTRPRSFVLVEREASARRI